MALRFAYHPGMGRLAPSFGYGVLCAVALFACAAPRSTLAQQTGGAFTPPVAGGWEPIQSFGQPPRLKPYAAFGFGSEGPTEDRQAGVTGALGTYMDLMNPVLGMLGASAELYGGQRGERLDVGTRLRIESRAFFVHAGIDLNARLQSADFTAGLTMPLRRSGWFRRGGQLRVDWIPARGQTLILGAQLPLAERYAGRTRPRTVTVPLPAPPRAARRSAPAAHLPEAAAVEGIGHAMQWLVTLHNFFWLTEHHSLGHEAMMADARRAFTELRNVMDEHAAHLPDRGSYAGEAEFYHQTVDHAFGLALGAGPGEANGVGRELADRARRIILEEVVLPYNAAIGQYKLPDNLRGLAARARARFIAALLLDRPHSETNGRVLPVFDAWLAQFEAVRAGIDRLTRDDRMNWLPLALVLRPEDHATQQQIDALLELALRREITDGNATVYINAPQFQFELLRSIHETRAYHVLWIHDYRGRGIDGQPDMTAYTQTAHGYLRALIDRVREYDETGALPVFLLLLDQHSYEHNDSRMWMDLLERPLTHRVRLGRGGRFMEDTIAALQDSLRAAVAASNRLHAEAEAFGPDWVRSVVKVHVNITNPADFSFRTRRLLGVPFGADNLLRDHRKIVIRDVIESDPSAGEMMLAGVGVGDWYATPTWDDRALVLQGPAAIEAKRRARDVLERHGLGGAAMPPPLRPVERGAAYDARIAAMKAAGAGARAMQLHNRTGWGDKEATYAQMLLYDLAPAGTVIYVPDSIWTNAEWMAQLVSAAMRGCRVYVVAPSLANAPSAGFPQLSVMQELVTRSMLVREHFGDVIADADGDLRIGLYTRASAYDDIPGLVAEFEAAFARYPFLGELFPLAPRTWTALYAMRDHVQENSAGWGNGDDRRPKMHRKTQLFASAEVLRRLAAAPELAPLVAEAIDAHAGGIEPLPETGPLVEQHRLIDAAALPRLYEAIVPAETRDTAVLYFMVGSLNKDARSMALDGEAAVLLSGAWALQSLLDFAILSTGVTWLESVEEVDALLPPQPLLLRWIGRRLRSVL